MTKLQKAIKKDKDNITFKKLSNTQYEHITPKYDFYLTQSGGLWGVDVFDHKVKDNDKAYIKSYNVDSFKDGVKFIKQYR
jgi:hypothetical protein